MGSDFYGGYTMNEDFRSRTGKALLLNDIKDYVMDDIAVYRCIGDGVYEDLYSGNAGTIPEELLKEEVRAIGGEKRGVVDIKIN